MYLRNHLIIKLSLFLCVFDDSLGPVGHLFNVPNYFWQLIIFNEWLHLFAGLSLYTTEWQWTLFPIARVFFVTIWNYRPIKTSFFILNWLDAIHEKVVLRDICTTGSGWHIWIRQIIWQLLSLIRSFLLDLNWQFFISVTLLNEIS